MDSEPVYATFWERLLAWFLDGLAVGTVSNFLVLVTAEIYGSLKGPEHFASMTGAESSSGSHFFTFLMGGLIEGWYFVVAIPVLIGWLYFAGFESSRLSATPGKCVIGAIVTDTAGKPVSFLQASGRFFMKYISTGFLFMGWFMMLWSPLRQTLHDLTAGTMVVKKRSV